MSLSAQVLLAVVLGGPDRGVDALVYSAEAGAAWTLVYPAYAVVVPEPGRIKVPLAYAAPLRNGAMVRFLNTWIQLKQKDGSIDALFQHWILGRDAKKTKRRWSVLHDVLGWGEGSSQSSDGPAKGS